MGFTRHPFHSLGRRFEVLLPRPGAVEALGAILPLPGSRAQRGGARCKHVEDARWIDRLLEPIACLECQTDDRSIAAGLRAGDERAFGLLIGRETADVFRICYRILGSSAEAEEATQEAFATAHRSLATFDGARPAAWLALIAVRQAWDFWLKRSDKGPASPLPDSWKALPTDEDEHPAYGDLGPDERARVRRDLASMPDDQREVIMLYFYAGLSLTEIASITGCPAAAAATRFEDGVDHMRESIGEGGT